MDKSRSGIFNVLVELHTDVISEKPQGFDGITVQPFEKKFSVSNFDISFEFKQGGNGIELLLVYNTDLFDSEDIVLMKERFSLLLHNVLNDFDENRKVEALDLTPPQIQNNAHSLFSRAGVVEKL